MRDTKGRFDKYLRLRSISKYRIATNHWRLLNNSNLYNLKIFHVERKFVEFILHTLYAIVLV